MPSEVPGLFLARENIDVKIDNMTAIYRHVAKKILKILGIDVSR
jgi:hypothetical protein